MQTSFTPESKRRPQANEIAVQVFEGDCAKYVFCLSIEDAKTCVELHRNWGIPAGTVAQDAEMPQGYKMPQAVTQW